VFKTNTFSVQATDLPVWMNSVIDFTSVIDCFLNYEKPINNCVYSFINLSLIPNKINQTKLTRLFYGYLLQNATFALSVARF
jgi:hypothetical protein